MSSRIGSIAVENDLKIAFEDFNITAKKPLTIICLPSLGDRRQEYRFLNTYFIEKGYRVLNVDHRGIGESDVGFSSYKPEDCAQDVIALIDKEIKSEEKVLLIGNSFGKQIIPIFEVFSYHM